jgi:hypothetical protein
MIRLVSAVVVGLVIAAVPASTAMARGPKWQFAQADPFTLPADVCGFPVLVEPLRNDEYSKTVQHPDGSLTIQITGFFSSRYTNVETGTSLTARISGPITIQVSPDGSFDVTARGRNGIIFLHEDAVRLGLPELSIMSGRFTEHVASDGTITSASLRGTIHLDVCAAIG